MLIESLSPSTVLSASPPLENHSRTPQSTISTLKSSVSHFHPQKDLRLLKQTYPSIDSQFPPFQNPLLLSKTCLSLTLCNLFNALPSFASETVASSSASSDKINLEAILVSIDDFFNRNPFFVAGCTFIWLVVVPVSEYYLKKYKYVSTIDAFRKIRDNPAVQLLDIRDAKTVADLRSPSLNYMNKSVVQVEFDEGNEDAFVKKVKESFKHPENTSICILDNSDGNSLKVAELLFKNGGFKDAFAIKGGVRGKKGWVAIQEELLPRTVHMKLTKKGKAASKELKTNGAAAVNQQNGNNDELVSSSPPSIPKEEDTQMIGNGDSTKSSAASSAPPQKVVVRHSSSSPYPNYPDMKPPSSPTPSKPKV